MVGSEKRTSTYATYGRGGGGGDGDGGGISQVFERVVPKKRRREGGGGGGDGGEEGGKGPSERGAFSKLNNSGSH